MKLESVDKHLQEKLKDPYFKELHELEEQKLGIVKRIVDYRVRHGLTQGRLASKVGVTQQHISKIENGDFSSIATLEKVLLAIGYTVRLRATPLSPWVANRIERFLGLKGRSKAA